MNDLMTKSFLSYVELKKQAKKDEESSEQRNHDIEKGGFDFIPEDEHNLCLFYQETETIKTLIEEIANLLLDLETLNEETKSAHSNKILRGLRDMMESNILSISRKSNNVKALIESLEKSNVENKASFKEGSCVDRTRVSITNGLKSKLRETMSEFSRLRERIYGGYIEDLKRRHFLATGEEASNEDMEKKMMMMLSSSSGESCCLKTVTTEMDKKTKERYEAVNDVKKNLNRLQQVFLDMAMFVETQGDRVDDIEANVANGGSFVSGGTNSLFYANQMKKKNNKMCVVVCVSVLCLIVFLVCLISTIVSRVLF